MFTSLKKAFTIGVAALTMAGAVATSTTQAQAQVVYYGPGWGYGYPYYGGYHGYGAPYYGVSYGYPYYGYRYYPRYRRNGAAIAASLIGGLALGALAASAARPAVRTVYRDCFVERRRTMSRSGRAIVRSVRVCR